MFYIVYSKVKNIVLKGLMDNSDFEECFILKFQLRFVFLLLYMGKAHVTINLLAPLRFALRTLCLYVTYVTSLKKLEKPKLVM